MKNCPVLLLLAACALVAASAPTFAQTGIPALDNAIKKLERLAPSAPAQGPAAEAPTKQPTQQAPEQPTATAPESRAKRDLDLVGVRLGMTLAEAQAALKNRNPNYEIEVLNVEFPAPGAMKFISGLHAQHNRKFVSGRSITSGGLVHVIPGSIISGEAVQVIVSGPPTSPTVLGIARHETFRGEEPNADQFVAALTQKFGTPDVADQHGSTFYWFPDLPKPLQTGNSARCSPTLIQMGIQTEIFVHMLRAPLWSQGDPQPNYLSVNHPALAANLDWSKPLSSCGPVVWVQLIRTGPQRRLLMWYNMYLFDFASTYKNMADLRQHVREAKADKDNEVIDQSEKQKKPTF